MEQIMQRDPTPYGVYVSVDPAGRIYAINSDAFIFDTRGWVKIDEGYGDRYHHAQGNYLDGPLMDERGILRYRSYPSDDAPSGEVIARYVKDGVEYLILERPQEEMDADYVPPEQRPTTEQRVDALETTTDDIILMMAELIGG